MGNISVMTYAHGVVFYFHQQHATHSPDTLLTYESSQTCHTHSAKSSKKWTMRHVITHSSWYGQAQSEQQLRVSMWLQYVQKQLSRWLHGALSYQKHIPVKVWRNCDYQFGHGVPYYVTVNISTEELLIKSALISEFHLFLNLCLLSVLDC